MSAIARIAASTGYSPQDLLVWNGSAWVSVPAGANASFALGLLYTATGAATTPGGHATFTLGLSFTPGGESPSNPPPPDNPPPNTGPGTVWLYTPPQWSRVTQVMGSLTSRVPVSTLVYRMNGVWTNQMGAYMDNPVVKNVDVDADTGLLLYFDRPSVIPGSLVSELLAVTTADDSWTDGTLIQL